MRIIAGYLGGRKIDSPRSRRTHPMSDKVRGALFNALGDIANLTVLDAFTGSGALSLEAISRGADHVTAIDIDKSAINSVESNIKSLNIHNKVKAIRANASAWSDNNPNVRFDIIFCDPPYDQVRDMLLFKLAEHAKIGGLLVFSLPPKSPFSLPDSKYQLLSAKEYGDAELRFYRAFR